MLEQELKHIWKSYSVVDTISFKKPELKKELREKVNDLEVAIVKRDRLEIVLAIFMSVLFGFLVYMIPYTISKVGSAVILGSLLLIIYKLKFNKKNKIEKDLTLSYKDQLENQKLYLLQEVRLIDTFLLWYLSPLFTGIMLFIYGISDDILPAFKMLYAAGVFMLFMILYFLNMMTLRKTYYPLIKEIDKVKKQLVTEE